MLQIIPILAFNDNYIWLLHHKGRAILVDPGDASPVLKTLSALKLTISAILITHHHADHIGGVETLLRQYPDATVYAPKYGSYTFEHIAVDEKEVIYLTDLKLKFDIMWLPGHTNDHIAYLTDNYLFCGDVLFGAGCGRLFEGTPAQMLSSLNQLKKLKPSTQVYCGHEYTERNIKFALTIEANNQSLIARQKVVESLRSQKLPSLPSSIGLELATNPFLRCDNIRLPHFEDHNATDELLAFTEIRKLRNHY